MAQFVAGQALGLLAERTPLRKLSDGGDLLDRDTQLDLFRWRHEHLLESAARRLKRGIDAKRDPFSVLVDCQDHVVEAARSWIDLVVLEAFPEDEAVAPLRNLYALHTIEAERGLLPRARPDLRRALEGADQGRQRALRRAAARRAARWSTRSGSRRRCWATRA